ncbi:MAG: DUF924 family protein [Gammaproteobacteria bacterium]
MSEGGTSAEDVLAFWFGQGAGDDTGGIDLAARNRVWFGADPAFDETIRARFGATLDAAAQGELRHWKLAPRGTLALVLVFDQFPRNIFRGSPRAFAYDDRALALCRDAIAMGSDAELAIPERLFFYLPLEHAEDPEAQARSVACFERLHDEAPAALRPHTGLALRHAREHAELIRRFGRFPHRNLALDRAATAAETDWLRQHAGAYGQG